MGRYGVLVDGSTGGGEGVAASDAPELGAPAAPHIPNGDGTSAANEQVETDIAPVAAYAPGVIQFNLLCKRW